MSNNEFTPNLDIPYGYCHCGCGQKTKIADQTYTRYGVKAGEPNRYIRGHAHHQATPEEIAERFWSKVDKSGGDDACWLWKAKRTSEGYGQVRWDGTTIGAHRVAYQLAHGSIPDGLFVCHNCPEGDNPSCVNPAHLWLGTNADNIRDRHNKGRDNHPVGEKNGRHKLNDAQRAEICRLYEAGGETSYANSTVDCRIRWKVRIATNERNERSPSTARTWRINVWIIISNWRTACATNTIRSTSKTSTCKA